MAEEETEQDQVKNPELIRLLQSGTNTKTGFEITSISDTNSNCSICEWTADETGCLLKLIAEYEYLQQLNSKNEQVYTKLSKLMTINGHEKTQEDIKHYWNHLQQKYDNHKTEKLENFVCADPINSLTNLNINSHSEPEILIVKGEELEDSILNSPDSFNNFSNEDYESINGRGIRRNNWSRKETECIVEVLEKYGMPNRTNLRKCCFVIVDYLKQHGFTRSEEQAQVKIKHLRALYNQVIRKVIAEDEFPYFKRFQALMSPVSFQLSKLKENEESQNYIVLDTQSKSDMEDFNEINEDDDRCFKKGRQIWTNKEVCVLLKFIEENEVVTGKQLRKVCDKAVDYLASHGYYRSSTQILIRWKNTKALYWATFRKKPKFPDKECSYFYQLHSLLNPDDCSYDGRSFDSTDHFYSNGETINSLETNSELPSFNFTKITRNQTKLSIKADDVINLQNSNSSDNFINVRSVSPVKRCHVTELPLDPLSNGESGRLTSSPKRNRTEQSEGSFHVGSCTFCNSLDHIDHYCISLAHSIKKLDARKQAKLKIEIQQLMYKAEFDSEF